MEPTLIELPDDIKLIAGVGEREDHTACVMSAVAWIVGEHHGDAPRCACPVIRELSIMLNDGPWWTGGIADRTAELLPLAKKIVGSKASADTEIARAKAAAEWAHTFVSSFALDAAALAVAEPHKSKLTDLAEEMRKKVDATVARQSMFAAMDAGSGMAALAVRASLMAVHAADSGDAKEAAILTVEGVDSATTNRTRGERKPIRDSLKQLIERLLEIR